MLGVLLIFSYCILISASLVFINFLERSLNPVLTLFFTFFFAFILLVFFDIKNFKSIKKQLRQHLLFIFFINFSTALNWLLEFIALKHVSAGVANSFIYGAQPIIMLGLLIGFTKPKHHLSYDGLFSLAIIVILFFMGFIRINEHGVHDKATLLIGIILSIFSSIFGVISVFIAKKLHQEGISTIDLVKIRLPLLILMSFIYLGFHPKLLLMPVGNYLSLLVLAIVTVILPLLALQQGINRVRPFTVTLILSSIPAITFFLQLFEPAFYYNRLIFILGLVLSATIAFSVIMKYKKKSI